MIENFGMSLFLLMWRCWNYWNLNRIMWLLI